MENKNNKKHNNAISRIAIFGITFCFFLSGLFAVGHKPIVEVHAEQFISGNAVGIIESNDMYRTFLPFDNIATSDITDPYNPETLLGGLDLNYYYHYGYSISTPSPTIPNTSLNSIFIGNWDYDNFYNYLYFDLNTSWYSDFNVRCYDSYWQLGGVGYSPYTNLVDFRLQRITFNLSQPILVDYNAGDTTFTIVNGNYDSSATCLKWTAKLLYTISYVDVNNELQSVNVTISDTEPFAVEYGEIVSIMPSLPSDANLNYPYMLYKYSLQLTPFSPSGVVTELTNNYAFPLVRFDSYAYNTVDYRFLDYEFYETNITVVDPVDDWVEAVRSFFFDSVHSFLSTEILPGITFYWILFICVGIPILIAILKIWLGG